VSADLHRARDEVGEVVSLQRFGELVELSVRLPHLAATARPGEFAQLRCGYGVSPLLRRPFSVAWVQQDCCSFVFQEVGAGTAFLGRLRPGDGLEALGPLGNGFAIDAARGPVVCVSGGVGCAPFPLLIARLQAHGITDITVVSGAASASRLYPLERFDRATLGVRVLEATDDGSRGRRGMVTDLLREAGAFEAAGSTYACGPNAMLGALADAGLQGRLQASLEAPMGCGFGICLGCAIPLRVEAGERWALCCTEGPVFELQQVAWERLRALPEASVA